MKTQILRGSKKEIAEILVHLNGEVKEAIIFFEEDDSDVGDTTAVDAEEFFAEIRPLMVDAPEFDGTREAIYSRAAGE